MGAEELTPLSIFLLDSFSKDQSLAKEPSLKDCSCIVFLKFLAF
jgi:hypothetical protein